MINFYVSTVTRTVMALSCMCRPADITQPESVIKRVIYENRHLFSTLFIYRLTFTQESHLYELFTEFCCVILSHGYQLVLFLLLNLTVRRLVSIYNTSELTEKTVCVQFRDQPINAVRCRHRKIIDKSNYYGNRTPCYKMENSVLLRQILALHLRLCYKSLLIKINDRQSYKYLYEKLQNQQVTNNTNLKPGCAMKLSDFRSGAAEVSVLVRYDAVSVT